MILHSKNDTIFLIKGFAFGNYIVYIYRTQATDTVKLKTCFYNHWKFLFFSSRVICIISISQIKGKMLKLQITMSYMCIFYHEVFNCSFQVWCKQCLYQEKLVIERLTYMIWHIIFSGQRIDICDQEEKCRRINNKFKSQRF